MQNSSLTFDLRLIAPNGVMFEGLVASVKFTSETGEMMMYHNHENYICAIKPCEIEYESEDGEQHKVSIKGGFCKFSDGKCDIAVSDLS